MVNALSNQHHPCRSLADLLALTEHFGHVRGLRAAFVGDARSNTYTSFLEACVAADMHLTIASPPGYEVAPDVLTSARCAMANTGGSVSFDPEPYDAVRGADAVYAEVCLHCGAVLRFSGAAMVRARRLPRPMGRRGG